MYDIAIIGAGPAGATLARLIGKRYKVLLVEKRDLSTAPTRSGDSKCCGGLLAPDAQKAVAALGLELPENVLVQPQVSLVRAIDLQHRLERYYRRNYVNIDREKFDRWLVSLIPSTVDARFGLRFDSCERLESGFKVFLSDGDKTHTEDARILIGADGASSTVRKGTMPEHPLPKAYIAVQEWFSVNAVHPYYSAIFDQQVTDFYSWTIPKDDILIVGAALPTGEEATSRFELLKRKLREYGFDLGRTVKREAAFLLRPLNGEGIFPGENGVALVGEAAGWISPSSAEGLSYAFRTAEIVAHILEEGTDQFLSRYQMETKPLRRNILLKNLKSHLIYHPTLRRILMWSGIQSVRIT